MLIPGDPERETEAERSQYGIPVFESVVKELEEVGEKLGVKL